MPQKDIPHDLILSLVFSGTNILPELLYLLGPISYPSSPTPSFILFYSLSICFASIGLRFSRFDKVFLLHPANAFSIAHVYLRLPSANILTPLSDLIILCLFVASNLFSMFFAAYLLLLGFPPLQSINPYEDSFIPLLPAFVITLLSLGSISSAIFLNRVKVKTSYRRFLSLILFLSLNLGLVVVSSYYPSRTIALIYYLAAISSYLLCFTKASSVFKSLFILASILPLVYAWTSISSFKASFELAVDVPALLEGVWMNDTGFAFTSEYVDYLNASTGFLSPLISLLVGYLVHTFWMGYSVFEAYSVSFTGLQHSYLPIFSAYWFVGAISSLLDLTFYRQFVDAYLEWGISTYPSSYRSWYGFPSRLYQDYGFVLGLLAAFFQGLLFRLLFIFSVKYQPFAAIRILSLFILYLAVFLSVATGLFGECSLLVALLNVFGLIVFGVLRCFLAPSQLGK